MPADAGAPGAPGTPARDPPVCRHWRRGGCLYGETCRFAHPPDALGASAGDAERAGSGAGAPSRNNRRVKKKGRCGHLRRFLIDAFGAECVGSGAPILDVGGGRGELAFELANLNGANCVVVDAVPLRLARYREKLERGWYDRSAPLARYNDDRRVFLTTRASSNGDDDGTERDGEEKAPRSRTPTHLRLLWSPTLWRVEASNDVAGKTKSDRRSFVSRGSRIDPDDSCTKESVDVVSTPEPELRAATRELHAMATYSAWAAATRVAFPARSEKKTKKITERDGDGDEEDEASLFGNAHGASTTVTDALVAMAGVRQTQKRGELLSDGVRFSVFASDAAADSNAETNQKKKKICECADALCGESPPDASFVRSTLRTCVMVVGMHSDQATEWIVDFALEHRVRFAVVPCCVCPGLFPSRRVFSADGSGEPKPVRSHAEFCEYLRGKAKPGEIELAHLPFEGKNTVVFSAFDTKGGRGYRARRAE